MRQQLEDQKDEIEELKKRLQTAHDNMIASRGLYEEQQKLHQNLIGRWMTISKSAYKQLLILQSLNGNLYTRILNP